MNQHIDPIKAATIELLLRLGDSTLILGQRVSEWCGHAPALEEDIALANQALDLIGQCQFWLGLAGEIEGKGRSADNLAYLRDVNEFRNVILVERPNSDFGTTLMRQFFFDAWHITVLSALKQSSLPRIVEIAAKAEKEVAYHLERSADLVIRLGDGTADSHKRMQTALDKLYPYTGEMFTDNQQDLLLESLNIAPLPSSLREKWNAIIIDVLQTATLTIPVDTWQHGLNGAGGGKDGIHSEHLGHILAEMQFLQRAYPGATW